MKPSFTHKTVEWRKNLLNGMEVDEVVEKSHPKNQNQTTYAFNILYIHTHKGGGVRSE